MKKYALAALGALTVTVASADAASVDQADRIIDGHYQAVLGDCMACHTSAGGKPFAGGLPLPTPFGTLVSPNITPDEETGIGNWTEKDFLQMMRTGIGHNGVRLYPAMPYPAYSKMTDTDISNLWGYLTTLEPVKNKVEANQLPFPFNIRFVMAGWNWLNFKFEPFKPDPSQSAAWNRGAYLVQGTGHCATCHSPKTFLGADKSSAWLEGGSLNNFYAPNITGDTYVGVGSWSEDEIVAYLKSGSNSHAIASGPMAEAIRNSTSQMTDSDLKAIAVYLKGVQGSKVEKPAAVAEADRQMTAGKAIYHDECSACHGGNGAGQLPLFPALASNPAVQQASAETLVHVVLAGAQGAHTPTKPTTPAMPSFAWKLSDQQVADVVTYVRNSWGNAAPAVSASDVANTRAATQP